MALKCESCGRDLTSFDLSSGRCPTCRTRIRRATAEQTLEANAGEAAHEGTLFPAASGPGQAVGDSGATVAPDAAPDRRHIATADTSLSLSSPSVKTVEATDTPSVPRSPVKPAEAGKKTAIASSGSFDSESLASRGASQLPRRHDSIATVDPRYFGPDEWSQWGKSLTGKASATRGSFPQEDPRRSTSTDSRYVGRTPVSARPLTPQGAPPMPGDEYSVVGRLGEGGMGVVYLATQRAIARDVALKMLKPDTSRRRDRRDSLATEAIVTGELAHPNIVPVYDLGQDADGSLFYSMKRVEGIRWDTVIGTKSEGENLEILLRVADAIAFAHDRGVVNRDLKPENVFLGGFGEVLVMDWGLAYATDRFKKHESVVENASMGGSPAYMAPEQARNFLVAGGWRAGEIEPITPSIDIYLLGAMLFEIVTGQPPHGSDDPTMCVMAAAENQIRHHESTSQLLPIALKAMAAESADRYPTVQDFQQAIREYLAHAESLALTDRARIRMKEGDLARAVVAFEDALSLWPENPEAATKVVVARRRLTRRRYALTAMTAAFLIAIAGGSYGVDSQRRIAVKERGIAVKERGIAEDEKKKAIAAAESEREAHKATEKALAAEEEQKRLAEERRIAAETAEAKALDAEKVALLAKNDAVEKEKLARDAEATAKAAAQRAEIARLEANDERERQAYLRYKAEVANIDRAIQSNQFVQANSLLDRLKSEVPKLCGWEWERLKYLCTQGRQAIDVDGEVTAATVSDDGSFAVTTVEDGRLMVWERAEYTSTTPSARLVLNAPAEPGLDRPSTVVVSQDGQKVAAAGDATDAKPAILIWPVIGQEQRKPQRLEGHEAGGRIHSLTFFANDSRLLSAATTGEILIWDVNSGTSLGRLDTVEASFRNRVRLSCAAVSPDGTRVAAGTSEGGGLVFVWSLAKDDAGLKFANQRTFLGHQSERVHGDGFKYRSGTVTSVSFSEDGRSIYSGDGTGHVLRWNPEEHALTHDEMMAASLKSAEAGIAAALKGVDVAKRADNAKSVDDFSAVNVYDETTAVLSIDISQSPSGQVVVATAGENGVVKLWEPSTWDDRGREPVTLAEFRGHQGRVISAVPVATAEGWSVFSAGEDDTARLWTIDSYAEVTELAHTTLKGHEDAVLSAKFDPSGRFLVTAGAAQDRRLIITDLSNRRQRREDADIAGVAPGTEWVVPILPEGDRLLTGSADGSTVLWDTKSRTPLRRLFALAGNALLAPAASADGRWVASLYTTDPSDRSIAIWSSEVLAASGTIEPTPVVVVELQGEPAAAAFTRDSQFLVAGDAPLDLPPRGGTVYVASPTTKEITRTTLFGDGEQGRVAALRALSNNEMLVAGKASSAADVRLIRWNPTTRKASAPAGMDRPWALTLPGAADLVDMAIVSDDSRVVTLTTTRERSQMLQLWDLTASSTTPLVEKGPFNSLTVTSLALSPDDSTLLIATEQDRGDAEGRADGKLSTVRMLELETLEDFGDDNQSLLTQKAIGAQAFPTGVTGIAFAPGDGNRPTAFLAGARGVYEFDLTQRTRLPGLFGSHGAAPSSSFSSDGRYLISGRQDGSFDIFDAASDSAALSPVRLEAPGVYRAPVIAATFTPVKDSYQFLIGVGRSLELHEFDPEAGTTRLLKAFTNEEDGPTMFADAAFSQDGHWIVAVGQDGIVRLFDTQAADAAMLALTPDVYAEGVAEIRHTKPGTSVAIAATPAPGGRLVIASGSEDGSAILWVVDPNSQRVDSAVPLRGHTNWVTDVAFVPGRFDRVLTGSRDRTARIWDWDGGGIRNWDDSEELANVEEPAGETLILSGLHTDGLTVVDFSPDGHTALTAGADGRVVLWPTKERQAQAVAGESGADDAESTEGAQQ